MYLSLPCISIGHLPPPGCFRPTTNTATKICARVYGNSKACGACGVLSEHGNRGGGATPGLGTFRQNTLGDDYKPLTKNCLSYCL